MTADQFKGLFLKSRLAAKMTLLCASMILFVDYSGVFADATANLRYLKTPMVRWDQGRLTGELKNVPVKDLLQDLMKSAGFDCKIDGHLPGVVSIRFRNSTIEQIISQIMRTNQYNYTLVSDPDWKHSSGKPGTVELIIYQGYDIVRFTAIQPSSQQVPSRNERLAAAPQSPSDQSTIPGRNHQGEAEFDRQVKVFLDEMLRSGKISKKDHEQALAEIDPS